jgi:hypothetical protein
MVLPHSRRPSRPRVMPSSAFWMPLTTSRCPPPPPRAAARGKGLTARVPQVLNVEPPAPDGSFAVTEDMLKKQFRILSLRVRIARARVAGGRVCWHGCSVTSAGGAQVHPDKNQSSEASQEAFARLNLAWKCLSDASLRGDYIRSFIAGLKKAPESSGWKPTAEVAESLEADMDRRRRVQAVQQAGVRARACVTLALPSPPFHIPHCLSPLACLLLAVCSSISSRRPSTTS